MLAAGNVWGRERKSHCLYGEADVGRGVGQRFVRMSPKGDDDSSPQIYLLNSYGLVPREKCCSTTIGSLITAPFMAVSLEFYSFVLEARER